MKEKSANGILSTTIEKVRDLVDVSTIIGEPINLPDGLTIIPVSKVTVGAGIGGGAGILLSVPLMSFGYALLKEKIEFYSC